MVAEVLKNDFKGTHAICLTPDFEYCKKTVRVLTQIYSVLPLRERNIGFEKVLSLKRKIWKFFCVDILRESQFERYTKAF